MAISPAVSSIARSTSSFTSRSPGRTVDRKRLFFYQVLGNAKMSVICLTGIRDFAEGRTSDPTMVILLNLVLPILLEDLAALLKLV